MKPREATESLVKILRDYAYTSADDWNALETAKEALEKQVPMKPNKRMNKTGFFRDCPDCGFALREEISRDKCDFCSWCGKAIDWSTDEN